MATAESPHERFAYEVVRQVLGVAPRHIDDNRTPGLHDALLDLSDGTTAAFEVTRLVDPRAVELLSHGMKWELDAHEHWFLHVGPGVSLKDVRRHHRALMDACRAAGVERPDQVRPVPQTAAFDWYERSGAGLWRMSAETPGPGFMHVALHSWGTFGEADLTELGPWLDSQRDEPWLATNIAKLAASGRESLHLFVTLLDSRAPHWLIHALMEGPESIVTEGPHRLAPLTDLWLLGQWGQSVIRWSQGVWTSHTYEPPPRR